MFSAIAGTINAGLVVGDWATQWASRAVVPGNLVEFALRAAVRPPQALTAGALVHDATQHCDTGSAMSEFLFTSESVSEGPPRQGGRPDFRRGPRCDSNAGPAWAGSGGDAGIDGLGRDDRRDHDRPQARLRAHRARHDPSHRLHRPRAALRRGRLRGHGLLRPAVARHRARRRPHVRRIHEPGRGRPGPDVRLRLRRDAGADAVPDLLRASPGAAAERSAPRWTLAVAASGREVAGDGALRRRQADQHRHRRAVDAASSRA